MPSGKRAKQQRREAAQRTPPPVRSKGGGGLPRGPRQASPRVLAIGGGVVVIVIVAIVLAVVLGGSGKSNSGSADGPTINIASGTPQVGSSTGPDALPGAADVAKLLKGIPQNHFILGQPTAPVELIEFIDLQCPVCQQFETTELRPLIDKYVRTGKLKIYMRPWSILDRTPAEHDSNRGQNATIAAAAQNKAFNFAEVLYDNQGVEGSGWLNDAMVSQIAASVDGLNTSQLATDANSSATASIVKSVDSYAAAHPQINGTPTIYLAKGIQQPQFFGVGYPNLQQLESAIDALLK